MKKILLILAIGLLMPVFMTAQELSKMKLPAPVAADLGDYDCPDGAIFSQPPAAWYNAYINSFSYVQVIYDKFYGVAEPIQGIRYWQVIYPPLTYPVEFTIEFYTDNGGSLGTLVNSWVMNLSPTFLTVDGFGVMDITLPTPVNLSTGWLGINASDDRLNAGGVVGWVDTGLGDNNIIYSLNLVNYNSVSGYNLSFCLVGNTNVVPISGWAIGIGIMLIFAFTLFRIKKS